ncbi:Serine/threonine-protein kinase rio2 [Heracleum sosnowskyi]|uniref:Serine/threonine-protein kinase rio2 n=1 Tax=Heracleum sosnowskyi TaxID=360622 RepID=A0AAD8HWH8_9APIA|nr:Serine/threonine-protein kinase rio2 [Heracleum sosnowskyi]
MNAVSNFSPDFIQDNASGSDSDSNAGDSPDYYLPISAAIEDDDTFSDPNSDEDHTQNPTFHPLPNGYANCIENGVASLDLSDDEEDETAIVTSETAIQRAFIEDENRRNAPLPAENATRVMEAMRGISFAGLAPDWSGRVREDMWIDQLRSIRRQSVSDATVSRPSG